MRPSFDTFSAQRPKAGKPVKEGEDVTAIQQRLVRRTGVMHIQVRRGWVSTEYLRPRFPQFEAWKTHTAEVLEARRIELENEALRQAAERFSHFSSMLSEKLGARSDMSLSSTKDRLRSFHTAWLPAAHLELYTKLRDVLDHPPDNEDKLLPEAEMQLLLENLVICACWDDPGTETAGITRDTAIELIRVVCRVPSREGCPSRAVCEFSSKQHGHFIAYYKERREVQALSKAYSNCLLMAIDLAQPDVFTALLECTPAADITCDDLRAVLAVAASDETASAAMLCPLLRKCKPEAVIRTLMDAPIAAVDVLGVERRIQGKGWMLLADVQAADALENAELSSVASLYVKDNTCPVAYCDRGTMQAIARQHGIHKQLEPPAFMYIERATSGGDDMSCAMGPAESVGQQLALVQKKKKNRGGDTPDELDRLNRNSLADSANADLKTVLGSPALMTVVAEYFTSLPLPVAVCDLPVNVLYRTLAHLAASEPTLQCLATLACGLLTHDSVIQCDKLGMTLLHAAAKAGRLDNLRFLLDKVLDKAAALDLRTVAGMTPLHLAAKGGHIDCVQLLLKSGAAVDGLPSRLGLTPLHMAVALSVPPNPAQEAGWCGVVSLLLQGKGKKTAWQANQAGQSPMSIVMANQGMQQSGLGEVFDRRSKSVDFDTFSVHGLVRDACREHQEGRDDRCINRLRAALTSQNVNSKSPADGKTALHVCRAAPVAELLVKAGADIAARDEVQNTPLHDFCRDGVSAELCLVVLKAGAEYVSQPTVVLWFRFEAAVLTEASSHSGTFHDQS